VCDEAEPSERDSIVSTTLYECMDGGQDHDGSQKLQSEQFVVTYIIDEPVICGVTYSSLSMCELMMCSRNTLRWWWRLRLWL